MKKAVIDHPDVEVGAPVIKGILSPLTIGSRCAVVFDQDESPYNFHTHPSDLRVQTSMFSVDDIKLMLSRAGKDTRQRIDYLGTEDGIYSLRFSRSLVSLFKNNPAVGEIVLFWYFYVINPIIFRKCGLSEDDRGCNNENIADILEMMNGITGEEMMQWIIGFKDTPAFIIEAISIAGDRLAIIDNLFYLTYE